MVGGVKPCLFHGISEFDSIEGIISQYIFKKLVVLLQNSLGLVVRIILVLF